MAQSLMERYDERIAGVLSCYDRRAAVGGVTIEHIGKSHIRKEEVVARVLALGILEAP